MISRPKLIFISLLALLATGLFQLIKTFTEIVWPNYLVLIHSVQQGYNTMLLDAVKQAQIEPVTASLTLAGLSFLYGIFHAAGPGHGKVVISTYLLSTGDQLRRGVLPVFFILTSAGDHRHFSGYRSHLDFELFNENHAASYR